ncbi:4Fe-4S binding protein [Azospirillum sp. TSO22-1]|uniref:4Fe-4S binding protein n=1 Tax=Azospirillum sp. TSO22-1 TaxID=716789 RepID=UPI000D65D16E|nr:4Fe-4S binding protein [Azospirillum sp. TSO22-1]
MDTHRLPDTTDGCAAQRAVPFRRGGRLIALGAAVERLFVWLRPWLPVVHGVMFVGFLAILFVPLLLDDPAAEDGPFDHFTVMVHTLLWGLWFPLAFLSVALTGRSWCGLLCPMGAGSEWAGKVGLKRPVPAWLRWPGTPVASFILVTVWGQTVGVRDHPEAAAILFGSVFAAALVIGFLFGRGKRAWCRHACPIGLLLGVYSRLGGVEFAPKRPEPGGDRWTEKTVCPTLIDLRRKTESRHCIECFRCVGPASQGGLYLKLRVPGAEIETVSAHNPSLSEVLFLFMGTGVALGGFLWLVLPSYQHLRMAVGDWGIDQGWYWLGEPGPRWLMAVYPERREVFRWLDFILIVGYMLSWLAALTATLSATTAASAWLSARLAPGAEWKARFVQLGYQYAPVAMVSLLLGLGSGLFDTLALLGLGPSAVLGAKGLCFALGALWSLRLGDRLLAAQGVPAATRWIPLLPGALGSFAIGAAWYPALFGA